MSFLKSFESFVKEGVVKKQSPDIERADSLIKEAENKKTFFEKIIKNFSIKETDPNYVIETCYDILIELIRAKLFLNGFNSSNSHEAEVAYMRNMGFNEEEVLFMDSLRYYRNGIKYYGRIFDKEYSLKVLDFLNRMYPPIKEKLK
jgi:hypothetical protein